MKCDELRQEENPIEWGLYYDKNEVDAAIAELKAKLEAKELEFANLKEDALNTDKAREKWLQLSRKQAMENRKLKRSLWLARAERAATWQVHWALRHNHSIEREFLIIGSAVPDDKHTTMKTPREWSIIWKRIYNKCRAKAEEYK